jgi:hypothetical protein
MPETLNPAGDLIDNSHFPAPSCQHILFVFGHLQRGRLCGFRGVIEHPVMKMIVALILIVTSIAEGWETLMSDLVALDAHHGVMIFGFVNLFQAIPEFVDAVERAHAAKQSVA